MLPAMSAREEILELEKQLERAELGPDASFFERVLADDVVLDGELAKARVVEAHRPSGTAKFTKVQMENLTVHDHGVAVVVTCTGIYEGPRGAHALDFMRVWVKKPTGWQIVAGSTAVKK